MESKLAGRKRDIAIIEIVGVLKLCKGLLLFAAALGAYSLWGSDVEATLTSLVKYFHVDPGNHYFRSFLTEAIGLSPKLPVFVVSFIAYGAVFVVEGMGLILRKHWAEYFTTIVTGSFLPIEVYELIRHANMVKVFLTVLNVAILIYFIRLLMRERAEKRARQAVA